MASESGTSVKITKKILTEGEDLMKELLELCGVEADVKVDKQSYDDVDGNVEEYVNVEIEGEEIGVLIGYLGRNLKSLQKIVGLMLNRRVNKDAKERKFVRVVIDVSGYREKREDSLHKMAEQAREEVVASGEATDLPPMTSYERRVIHTYLIQYDDVTTESFGEGRDRHVKVLPAGEAESMEKVTGESKDE